MDDDGMEFEMVAASLRADTTDLNAFLPALAVKLSGALPQQTSVQYHGGGLFSKTKTVQAIDVDLGDLRFHIEQQHGRIEASRQKAVRGIVLKNENLGLDAWIAELSRCISDHASSSEHGRSALQQLLEDA